MIHNPIMHKFDEPYYERNMQDIRSSIFTSKWIELVDKFTQEEIQDIHEFFLNDKTEVFFKLSGHSEEVKEAEKTEFVR